MQEITGVVERITYQNHENGFSVLKIKAKGYKDLVTVVGNLAGIHVGTVLLVRGEWKLDAKFGQQLKVDSYQEKIPASIKGIEKYLGSGLIKGIGPVYARKIVKKYQEHTLIVLEERPDELIKVEGIGKKRVDIIKKAWQEQKEIKNVMIFLQGHGVSTTYAVKIYKTYGEQAIEIVERNPYRLADDIWGIGFRTADAIAQKIGYDLQSYPRCRSGILYVLGQMANDGHCYAEYQQLIEQATELLEVTEQKLAETISQMLQENSLIREENIATKEINKEAHKIEALYLPTMYYSELGVSRRISAISRSASNYLDIDITEQLKNIQLNEQITYDEVQIAAIKKAVSAKFMVVTGGPGTGKTTTTLAIIKLFHNLGAKVLLAAPTGRAAKRMSETTGQVAKTIHRLLEYSPAEGYKKNEDNLLQCDVLLLDEVSMVDIVLMYNLLKAVPDDAVLILVGDVDQLPSVGPGNLLRDIINSGVLPVVKLTRIFRQALDSDIVLNAHRINKGDFPLIKKERTDFFFSEKEDAQEIVDTIASLCSKRLPSYYGVQAIADIQVLCPMQRGLTGAVNLNNVLQAVLNPVGETITYGATKYRVGDKVMQIRNNYDKNVFNGDIGIIYQIDNLDKIVTIDFENMLVAYDINDLDEIVLAYATTVHKSQGSEYKIVIAPITTQHYMMLQRNLLYTCVTRAKQVCILIGTKKALAMAIKNDLTKKRNTALTAKLALGQIAYLER